LALIRESNGLPSTIGLTVVAGAGSLVTFVGNSLLAQPLQVPAHSVPLAALGDSSLVASAGSSTLASVTLQWDGLVPFAPYRAWVLATSAVGVAQRLQVTTEAQLSLVAQATAADSGAWAVNGGVGSSSAGLLPLAVAVQATASGEVHLTVTAQQVGRPCAVLATALARAVFEGPMVALAFRATVDVDPATVPDQWNVVAPQQPPSAALQRPALRTDGGLLTTVSLQLLQATDANNDEVPLQVVSTGALTAGTLPTVPAFLSRLTNNLFPSDTSGGAVGAVDGTLTGLQPNTVYGLGVLAHFDGTAPLAQLIEVAEGDAGSASVRVLGAQASVADGDLWVNGALGSSVRSLRDQLTGVRTDSTGQLSFRVRGSSAFVAWSCSALCVAASSWAPLATQPSVATFRVTVAPKSPAHPRFGVGSALAYLINGVEAVDWQMQPGQLYTVVVDTVGHPLQLTASVTGGAGSTPLTSTPFVRALERGTLQWRAPISGVPLVYYYQCTLHADMGWLAATAAI
jgi:hypothetical protein